MVENGNLLTKMIDKIKELNIRFLNRLWDIEPCIPKQEGLAFFNEFALSLLQSDIERLEKTKLPYLSTLCQNRNGIEYCGTCEQAWEYCSCLARNTGYKKAIDSELSLKRQAIEELKK